MAFIRVHLRFEKIRRVRRAVVVNPSSFYLSVLGVLGGSTPYFWPRSQK